MGDPLSTTASIAGIISLGLQLSDGLIKYCRAYSSRDEDLLQLSTNAERLQSLLSLTGAHQQGTPALSSELLNSLEQCSTACGTCIKDVKSIVQKYVHQQHHRGIREHGHSLIRKLRYPFDKEEFEGLRLRLREFNENLVAHLQLLSLELTQKLRTDILSTSSNTILEISRVREEVLSVRDTIEHVGSSLPASIQGHLDQAATSLHTRLRETENNVTTNIQTAISTERDKVEACCENQTSSVLRRVDELEEKLVGKLEEKLTLHLASFIEGQLRHPRADMVPVAISDISNIHHGETTISQPNLTAFTHRFCTCFAAVPPTFRRNITRPRRNHHEGCIYAYLNRKKHRFSMQGRIFNRAVSLTVDLEYSLMAWTRDWEIIRNFTARVIVPHDAPAFELMDIIWIKLSRWSTPQTVEDTLSGYLMQLQTLFKEGKAWPTDIQPYRGNLLHYFCSDIVFYAIRRDTAMIFRGFICTLADLGVPLNELQLMGLHRPRTPLDWLLNKATDVALYGYDIGKRYQVIDLSHELEDHGAESSRSYGAYKLSMGVARSCDIFDLQENYQYGILPSILLQKSETRLIELLQTNVTVLSEVYFNKWTPLHLAVSWPKGLQLLLDADKKVARSWLEHRNDRSDTALDYAIWLQEVDSVRMLVNSGAKICQYHLDRLGKTRSNAVLLDSPVSRINTIIYILIENLARRRKELLIFALQNLPRVLPREQIVSLQLQDKTILDHEAIWIVQLLKLYNIHFPSYLDDTPIGLAVHSCSIKECIRRINEDRGVSVYHTRYIDTFIAQKLWDESFRRIIRNCRKMAPLVALQIDRIYHNPFGGPSITRSIGNYLDTVAWFEEHGENIYTWHQFFGRLRYVSKDEDELGFATIHQIAHRLGYLLRLFLINRLSQHHRRYLSHLLSHRIEDTCTCLCSGGGCTPASIFTRYRLINDIFPYFIGNKPTFAQYITRFIIVDTHELSTLDTVRVMTFEKLGMRHTCCRFDGVYDEPRTMRMDEVREIQEEDRYLAAHLNDLMAEFTPQLRDTHLPFDRFIEEVWRPRMRLWEQERDEITEEDRMKFLEIGVSLYES